MNISDEAVEAAARALHAAIVGPEGRTWEATLTKWQKAYRTQARATLHAAAPTIAAQVLKDTADEWSDWDALSAPEDWLRDRAARIEAGE